MSSLMTRPETSIQLPNAEEVRAVLQANVGAGGMTLFDLDRVQVPSGNSTAWTIPTLDGGEAAKSFEGVIVHWTERRRYYANAFEPGVNAPPDCFSDDCVYGKGTPGGDCAQCPYNAWGTAHNARGEATKGKACGQYRFLFVLRAGDVLPTVVSVPPSSLKPARQYFLRLASKGMPYYGVVTKFELEKGEMIAAIKFSPVASLSQAQRAEMEAYSKAIAPLLGQMQFEDNDFVATEPSV